MMISGKSLREKRQRNEEEIKEGDPSGRMMIINGKLSRLNMTCRQGISVVMLTHTVTVSLLMLMHAHIRYNPLGEMPHAEYHMFELNSELQQQIKIHHGVPR
jgi:hypothetical protein